MAIYERAVDLAADEELDDATAVYRLTTNLEGRRSDIRKAIRYAKHQSDTDDFAVANRSFRLLVAAASNAPVRPATDAQRKRFEVVHQLEESSEREGWNLLVSMVPGLGDVARRFPSPDDQVSIARSLESSESARAKAIYELGKRETVLHAELACLLGPKSGSSDPLLGSSYALEFAERCITDPGWKERDTETKET
jgi:hypothetical protein